MATPPPPAGPRSGALPQANPEAQQRARAFLARVQMMERIKNNLDRIDRKIVVMSGKGGVGKTTVCVNLAATFARAGKRVGVLDADLTNPNVPKMLGVEGARVASDGERLVPVAAHGMKVVSTGFLAQDPNKPIIWRGPIKIGVLQQFLGDVAWGDLDFLFFDLPPGTSDEPLSIAQEIPQADGAVVVTTPQEVSVLDIVKSIGFAKALNLRVLGIVENMSGFVCPHCQQETPVFAKGGGERAARETGVPFLGSIPLHPPIARHGDEGVPFVLGDEDSAAAKAFQQVVAELEKRLPAR
ncbi:MAG TPA: Mrp/NBP35 family ATP-binding protein [Candidatus Thermoplasmatota archaeon]|nr:Mrp/NBP35 family ATP-binding protein [Candidatus Thermoplasmatota archaeon]